MPIDDVAARGFEAAAAAYVAARPGYPDEALALLRDEVGIGPGCRVLDLAAGTGKLTRRLVELEADLVAVEPVTAMRTQLEAILPDVEVLDGMGEAIPVPDASVDVVTVAQAFHWFDAPAALEEIARVLRPGGRLALLWNERDERVAWVDEDWAAIVAASGRFGPLQERTVEWVQPMTRELLADRVRSISYIAAMPTAPRERLAAEVVSLVARKEEPFPLPYVCRVQWAALA